jgi:hypothetical protein
LLSSPQHAHAATTSSAPVHRVLPAEDDESNRTKTPTSDALTRENCTEPDCKHGFEVEKEPRHIAWSSGAP